jgi:GH15 family glucan-1,4-alpha-glucosidase
VKPLPAVNNGFSGALIDGTEIVWLPLPRYDSSPVFAKLLDSDQGGTLSVDAKVLSQRYIVPNVLLTKIEQGEIVDLMPQGEHALIRKIVCERLKVFVQPTFNYALYKAVPKVLDERVVQFQNPQSSESIEVIFDFPSVRRLSKTTWEVQGSGYIYLTHIPDERFSVVKKLSAGLKHDIQSGFEKTLKYWKNKMRFSQNGDAYSTSVGVLLGLLFQPTGAVVASPTTSLPEVEGGERNWDYRFAWVRDSSIVAEALLSAGYIVEARKIIEFFLGLVSFTDKPFRYPLYRVDGTYPPPEREIEWLSGYSNSKPVRVGNAAAGQTQLDIEGFFMNALYKYYELTRDSVFIKENLDAIEHIANWEAKNWMLKDASIWEERGVERHHTHSKAMVWVSLDRAGKLFSAIGEDDPWQEERSKLREWIFENCTKDGRFVRYAGSFESDAALLSLPLYEFIDAKSEPFLKTFEHITQTLCVDGFVKRYTADFLGEAKHPFTLTTLWYARVLIRLGKTKEAIETIERVLKPSKGLYLVGEHVDVHTGEYTGNYPQAFSQANVVLALDELRRLAR